MKQEADRQGVRLDFVATIRNIEDTVQSELHHWVIYDLEAQAGLDARERKNLEHSLRKRVKEHRQRIDHLFEQGFLNVLPLGPNIHKVWPEQLSTISDFSIFEWCNALCNAGRQNSNPTLPTEGILLTLRLGTDRNQASAKIASIQKLLDQIEEDSLCRYLVVLALDADERNTACANKLIQIMQGRAKTHKQLTSLHVITNKQPRSQEKPFDICSIWEEMAVVAWEEGGADWVMLLGDDITINCSFHYRAFYRSFLDISKRLQVPFGFGCPWWNDEAFPGFPSFPCVGKAHYKIFGGLIPEARCSNFVNQDLDPCLNRLHIKFMAAPCVTEAFLCNGIGGNIGSSDKPRYRRVSAKGWQDFAAMDIAPIRSYLPKDTTKDVILVDVVVPSYRIRLDYLQSICSLHVPQYMQTIFIIVIDNPSLLMKTAVEINPLTEDLTLSNCERILERCLSSETKNTIRVRCNSKNVGASASRNRGLDESAAEFVLNLDDDLIPSPDLLEQYGSKLLEVKDDDSIIGLLGLVRFPRSHRLPLKHAAVLMSYLTFMFEIAEQNLYNPAWGVTANILFRRTSVRFDLAYAKSKYDNKISQAQRYLILEFGFYFIAGGGEDVDFALRVAQDRGNESKLLSCPQAFVVHPFWPGSVFTLFSHFFNWAIGDCGLFYRFPNHVYWSFPNIPETLLVLTPFLLWTGMMDSVMILAVLIVIDFVVDVCYNKGEDFKHRCSLLKDPSGLDKVADRHWHFYLASHFLANLYVMVLECGRLYGHWKRRGLFQGTFRRFDWHCGQLKNARKHFRRREAWKFSLFVMFLICWFG